MKNIFNLLLYLVFCIPPTSCSIQKKNTENQSSINSSINEGYNKSNKIFTGTLNDTEYNDILKILEVELNTLIPDGKSILINYGQKAPNCILFGKKERVQSKVVDNGIAISSRISSSHNAVDFFVYQKNSYFEEIFQTKKEYKLDSGFFHDNIFTLHENCSAFFLLKPNGDFLKYYGEDYFSEVESFLVKD